MRDSAIVEYSPHVRKEDRFTDDDDGKNIDNE